MKLSNSGPQLDYFSEYPLGQSPSRRVRNAVMPLTASRDQIVSLPSNFPWQNTRDLEDRSDAPRNEGVWQLNHWRCQRRFGDPGERIFPRGVSKQTCTQEIWDAAKRMRLFCYFRLPTSQDAIAFISSGREVRFSCELTSEWYDPEDGVIPTPAPDAEVYGSHAVPLLNFVDNKFVFPNSWGEWGHEGLGAFSPDLYDNFILESWGLGGVGHVAPMTIKSGIVCLEWKWSVDKHFGIHGREIVDASSDERLGWAFCVTRGSTLDVEEFFVWPSERKRGYGAVLAEMIKRLAAEMKLPLRMLVSFADTEPNRLSHVEDVARLLGLHLSDSGQRWVHLFGLTTPTTMQTQRRRPDRPAFLLEWLRPRDEAPIEPDVDYPVLFGTDRKPLVENSVTSGFSGERGNQLTLGVVKVRLPQTPRFGHTGRLWVALWKQFFFKPVASVDAPLHLTEEQFFGTVRSILSGFDDRRQNLLFVHGYNVSFADSATQAARFGIDLKLPGTTFLYSWPSAARTIKYQVDEATIEAALPFLRDFIDLIRRQTSDIPLNIIVHSMGNRAITRYLASIVDTPKSESLAPINQVIFAAPDVDSTVFEQSISKALTLVERATLYTTRADWALQASEWLHTYSRAGLAPPVLTIDGMDTILVEGFNLLDLGHGYFANASVVMYDMFNLIHHGREPELRPKLVRTETTDGKPYWKMAVG